MLLASGLCSPHIYVLAVHPGGIPPPLPARDPLVVQLWLSWGNEGVVLPDSRGPAPWPSTAPQQALSRCHQWAGCPKTTSCAGRPCHSLLLTLGGSLLSLNFPIVEIMPEPRPGPQKWGAGCEQEKAEKPQVMTREGSQDGDFNDLNESVTSECELGSPCLSRPWFST